MGTRDEPLMVAVGTAGDDPQSWAYREHLEMLRILEDPERAPHVFVHMRHTPAEADPWDEANWHYANPALGQFLSIESLRDEALEAKNDPSKENAWRQYRLNQWVNQASRWLQLHMWDECTGDIWPTPDWGRQQLAGRPCYAGFDLAAKFDLTAFCLAFPGEEADDTVHMLWRFWLPEAGLQRLDQLNGGVFSQWAAKGWLTVTDGDVIDYDRVISDIGQDAADFNIVAADCDEWSMWPIINRVAETCGLSPDSGQLSAYRNTYDRMTSGLEDLYGLVKGGRLVHHGNPVARFCADMTEIRRSRLDPNLIRPSKPERNVSRARIDAIPTAAMALNALRNHDDGGSAYDTNGLMVV
jgi:phage terminase large subunit-like protein